MAVCENAGHFSRISNIDRMDTRCVFIYIKIEYVLIFVKYLCTITNHSRCKL